MASRPATEHEDKRLHEIERDCPLVRVDIIASEGKPRRYRLTGKAKAAHVISGALITIDASSLTAAAREFKAAYNKLVAGGVLKP